MNFQIERRNVFVYDIMNLQQIWNKLLLFRLFNIEVNYFLAINWYFLLVNEDSNL